jgi:hypothetical protein
MKPMTCKIILALALLFCAAQLRAQTYSVDWFKVAGGGGTSTGGVYTVTGTFGQQDAGGPMQGGGYSVEGGFWSLFAVQSSSVTGTAPTITMQPQSQFITNNDDFKGAGHNDTFSFNTSVSGTPPLFYQWQQNGVNLTDSNYGYNYANYSVSGSTTTNLNVTNATIMNSEDENYSIIVENAFGSVTSNVAKITQLEPTSFLVTNVYDATANFSLVNSNPNGTWSYTWSSSLDSTQTYYTIYQTENIEWTEGWTFAYGTVGIPLVAENATASQNGVWPPHTLGFHPGYNGEFSHVVWTAPVAGTYTVNVGFTMLDTGNTEVYVVQRPTNGIPIHLASGNVTAPSTNYTYSGSLALNAGDQIDFAVGWGNGSIGADTTALSPVISSTSYTNIVVNFPPQLQTMTATGGNFKFSWYVLNTSYPAVGYQVQTTTNLASASWINLGPVLTRTGPTLSATDTISTNAQRFYRVLLVQ